MDRGAWRTAVHGVPKNWTWLSNQRFASPVAQLVKSLPAMQEIWVRTLGWEDPLEKGMATCSSIRVWRIPWTEECGRVQSMGSERDTIEWLSLFTFHVYKAASFWIRPVTTLSHLLIIMMNVFCRCIYCYISLFVRNVESNFIYGKNNKKYSHTFWPWDFPKLSTWLSIWIFITTSGIARGNITAAGNDNIQMEHFNQFASTILYFCDADVEMENKQKGQIECSETACDLECCSLLLSASHRKITKATAPSTEGRCVMLSWQKTLLFSSTTPTQTLRRPKNYWFILPGMNWKQWAHSAGQLLKLCSVTISSKNATLGWYLLLYPFAGKIKK